MRFARAVLAACAALSLSACEDFQTESTRKEIYKLAFRTSQFQEALERCEAKPEVIEKHDHIWNKNFDAAAKWLEVEREVISERQKAGRDALGEDTELGCKVVLKAVKISMNAAREWADRIEEEDYCGIMGCE